MTWVGTDFRGQTLSRIFVFVLICALAWIAVPDASAQRSAVRGGSSDGHGRYHRENPGEDQYRESLEAENDKLEEELRKERRKRWETGEEEEDTRGPSAGPACMYAADGTLVWGPRGKSCGGAAANAAPATPRPTRANTPSTRKPTGSCMMGADGRVIYAPPGVDCGP